MDTECTGSRVRHHLLPFALGLSLAVPVHSSAQTPNRQIALGEVRTVRSAILNEDRELQITLPDAYGRTAIAHPVLLLLDGSSHLLHPSATVRFMAGARHDEVVQLASTYAVPYPRWPSEW